MKSLKSEIKNFDEKIFPEIYNNKLIEKNRNCEVLFNALH